MKQRQHSHAPSKTRGRERRDRGSTRSRRRGPRTLPLAPPHGARDGLKGERGPPSGAESGDRERSRFESDHVNQTSGSPSDSICFCDQTREKRSEPARADLYNLLQPPPSDSYRTNLSESAAPSVTVKFNETATLPCSRRCSGVVRWTVFKNSTDILAECDQTSCRSVKEGYQMIHDQYLKGDLSLTITEADLTKRKRYTCDCDDKDVCDVTLKIEPLNTTVQKTSGESLVLELDITEPVEVIYSAAGAAGPSRGPICTLDGRPPQCKPEYTQRASLTAALELRGMTPSDSGVYTIMDKRNEEVIRIYSVTVKDEQPCLCRDQAAAAPVWIYPALVLMGVVCAVSAVVNVWQRKENLQLRSRAKENREML
ncbi:hypothetical protein MHYP_G00263380 [Metynnis hypsauchen]